MFHREIWEICERFNRTVLDEFYRVVLRKRLYAQLDPLHTDLDRCYGNTPAQTFLDSLARAKEKFIA